MTPTVQEFPATSGDEVEQVVALASIAKFALAANPAKVSVEVPILETVTVWVGLTEPTFVCG